jgi:uroporphyrinogen-III synthase
MSTPIAYVLSTRVVIKTLVDEAAERGVMVDQLSFIDIEPLRTEIGPLFERPLIAVFTSGNAVRSIGDTGGRDWKIFCTGGATRQLAVDHFGDRAIVGTADSAAALAAEIIRLGPGLAGAGSMGAVSGPTGRAGAGGRGMGSGAEVYFFCGDQRRDELPELLKKAGIKVNEMVVYRTKLTPQEITRSYDGIAFFSPSTVESFFSVNKMAPETTIFAIGETTAAAVREHCENPMIIGDRPDAEALIRRMISYFEHKNS